MKSLFITASLAIMASALFAADITDISIRQRWPWSQKVDISYTLSTDEAKCVFVTLYSGTQKLAIPAAALSGDMWDVAPGGPRTITFDPLKTQYTNTILGNVRAVLATGDRPLYMIVNLAKEATDAGQVTYLSAYDITNSASAYGSWEWGESYHTGTNVDSRWQNTIVWTGVTNDTQYATTNLVLRYIPASTFTMGARADENAFMETWMKDREHSHTVELSKGFYAGIYLVTKEQYRFVNGSLPKNQLGSASLGPVNAISYHDIRGCTTNTDGSMLYYWPKTAAVSPSSFMGLLRAKTGLDNFDLPTDAQWEYACRAGTTGAWNDGTTITNGTTDLQLGRLGWYKMNCSGINEVGKKIPNAWGLYDMHGNAIEWCVDAYAAVLTDAKDPVGASTSNYRIMKGGTCGSSSVACRAAYRGAENPTKVDAAYSFRVFFKP